MTLIQNSITNICLNKPLYVGFSVLDLSKLHMYRFHYENMRERYSNINLCFTDTDSLLYEVETHDLYSGMLNDAESYDFSDYEPTHHCFDGIHEKDVERIRMENKKALGKFKDELKGLTLKELIGLRPKCYSLLYLLANLTADEKQTAKGVKMAVKKAFLRHIMYKETLENLSSVLVAQNSIKSNAHQIGSYHQNKIGLSDICDNGIDTRAFGVLSYHETWAD